MKAVESAAKKIYMKADLVVIKPSHAANGVNGAAGDLVQLAVTEVARPGQELASA